MVSIQTDLEFHRFGVGLVIVPAVKAETPVVLRIFVEIADVEHNVLW